MREALDGEGGEGAVEALVKIDGGDVEQRTDDVCVRLNGVRGGRGSAEFAEFSSTIKSTRPRYAEGRSGSSWPSCG